MCAERALKESVLWRRITRCWPETCPKPPSASSPGLKDRIGEECAPSGGPYPLLQWGFCLGSHWCPSLCHCTVIHGCVLGSHDVHLPIQRVLAIVSGDAELYRVCVAFATSIIANPCDPLQPHPWSPVDPAHVVTAEGESRACIGESQDPPGFTTSFPDSTSCTSHWTPADTRHPHQDTITQLVFLSFISTITLKVSYFL